MAKIKDQEKKENSKIFNVHRLRETRPNVT